MHASGGHFEPLCRAGRLHLPLVVLTELRAGFACGTRALENERNLARDAHDDHLPQIP